jgi:multiple sugar transport system permease protein
MISKISKTIGGLFITALLLFPIYLVLIFSFQTTEEMFRVPPFLFPSALNMSNFIVAVQVLGPYFINNIIIACATLILTLLIGPIAAYALAHYVGAFREHLKVFFLFFQMFPVVMVAIPIFLLFNSLGLVNSYVGVILADATYTVPFCIILLTSFFQSMPFSLVESALIDGAGHLYAFLKIVVPISKAGIASTMVLSFMMAWSDFFFALTLLPSKALQPMSLGLYNFSGMYGTNWPQMMAGGFIFAIPPLIIMMLGNKYVVSGLTAGAIKS